MRHVPLTAGLVLVGLIAFGSERPHSPARAQLNLDLVAASVSVVPNARERLTIRKALVREKLDMALPVALRAGGVDMWIVLDRENQADPLHDEIGAAYSGAGAAFIFSVRDGRIERIFLGSAQPSDSPVERVYDVKDYTASTREQVLRRLRQVVDERRPERIAINTSVALPGADGLTATLRDALVDALGPAHAARLTPAETLVHAFRATRTPLETRWYTALQRWTATWQTEALARVQPGQTTVLDLACGIDDRAVALGLSQAADHGRFPVIVWFGDRIAMAGLPGFGDDHPLRATGGDARDFAIRPGDLITLDGGLRFMAFASDMKRGAYMLKPGESRAPQSLERAWRDTVDVARLYARHLVPGVYADEVWAGLEREIRALGLEPLAPNARPDARLISVYGHPTGNVVHEVGARVTGAPPVAAALRLPFCEGEWVSIEFHLVVPATDAPRGRWYTRFEQTVQVAAGGATWLVPPQETLQIVPAGQREGNPRGSHRGAGH